MARKGDVGPYASWNIYLATGRQNLRDYIDREQQISRKEIAACIEHVNSFVGPRLPYEMLMERKCGENESETRARKKAKKSLAKYPS